MAEESQDSKDTQKRRVVKNPETFRERAVKASEASDKPKVVARIGQAGSKVTKPVTGPIGRGLKKAFSVPPLKWVAKLGHWIGLVLVPPYFRHSWRELKLVTWPTLKQSRQLTGAVLAFAVVFGVVIALVDYGLDKLFRDILLK